MAYVIACLMAALSFILNRAILRYIGINAVISASPAIEELSKTISAFYLGADILLTHGLFGVLEAIYDWVSSPKTGIAAAGLSIVGHSLFGLVTVIGLKISDSIFFAVAAGIVAHLVWNVTIIRITVGRI